MFIQIFIVLFLITVNALFAMAEMALVSVRRSRLQELAEAGDLRAKVALDLLKKPENFLSTIQTGVTLVGVLSGAVGGATIAESFTPYFEKLPFIGNQAEYVSFACVVLAISYFSLILGELVPKRWALSHSETLALTLAIPLRATSLITYPIVRFFSRSAEIVTTFLRIPNNAETPVSEEEIKIMLAHGERAGVVEEAEKEMIERVFKLGDRRVDSLMTHRTEIVWVDIKENDPKTWEKIAESGHSYFPVGRETIDDVVGIIAIKDLWSQLHREGKNNIEKILIKPLIVPGTISALRVLERFKEHKNHMALVVDEYGSLDGLVTVNDIVVAVLGYLPNNDDEIEPMVVEREDGSLLIDGSISFDEFEDLLDITSLPEEQRGDFQTLAGFIINHLGRFPSLGEKFEWSNHIFEIIDMDGHKIDRILLTPPANSGPLDISDEEQ